jgi:hypothetical protein
LLFVYLFNIFLQDLQFGEVKAPGTTGKVMVAEWRRTEVAVKIFAEPHPELFLQELTMIS